MSSILFDIPEEADQAVPKMASFCPIENTSARKSPFTSTIASRFAVTNDQALTLSILLGWISYVIALSQAGKSSPLAEALKGDLLGGQRGLGVFMSMAGGMFLLFLHLVV